MPISPEFARIRRKMIKDYGKEKGEEVYHSWLNKYGLDDTKPLSKQKHKLRSEEEEVNPLLELFPEEEVETPETDEKALHDRLNRREEANNLPHPEDAPHEKMEASKKAPSITIPMFKTHFKAEPKFEGKEGPIIIKAVVLEQGHNVNGWRVVPEEFERVAEQYKAGRQLRLNHDKTVQAIIGKSFDGKVVKGKDLALYIGKEIQGIDPDGLFVTAEFEANPQDPQVRKNILSGYVETGSIGLDANAFCDECGEAVKMVEDDVERTCHHINSPIKLKNVEVQEYSYVAEPAFQHTVAYPSFSAAVDSRLRQNSSLTTTPSIIVPEMSETNKKVEEPKIEASAKKAEAEGDAESMPRWVHDAIMEAYKKGQADALKYRAEHEPKEEEKASATAGKKTDQVGVVATPNPVAPAPVDKILTAIFEPTANTDPAVKALYKYAAKADKAPDWIQRLVKGRFE